MPGGQPLTFNVSLNMFALGFLFLAALFFFALILVGYLIPAGKYRIIFFLIVIASLITYPSLYKASSSYAKFKQLCEQADRSKVLKTKTANFIYLDWGYSSDCTKGPSYIEHHHYRGFDCKRGDQNGIALYRYTKKPEWREGCGLECFEVFQIYAVETNYRLESRQGYVDGDNPIITYEGAVKADLPSSAKLLFTDNLLWDDGVMAFSRNYVYFPYGRTWAKLLGMASGSPPSEGCKIRFSSLDPRDVYKSEIED